jgi:beta-lactamase regulating signal transducer with metallopeptidase domain
MKSIGAGRDTPVFFAHFLQPKAAFSVRNIKSARKKQFSLLQNAASGVLISVGAVMDTILEQINSMGKAFVGFVLPMLVQSSVLIAILLLADLVLRRKVRAVFRCWIWVLVLVQLVLPILLPLPTSLGHWFGDEIAYVAEEASVRPVASVTWQGIVLVVWLAVAAGMVLFLLQRAIFAKRLVAGARKANNLMNDMLWYCCKCMGVKGKIRLKVSPKVTSPVVWGLLRPVILVPHNLAPSLGSRHLRAVLLHELAHIRRGDLWVNLAQTVLQIVYFYNPLLWLANAIIRRVREQAVDEAVLAAMGEKARWYPETLVNVAKLALGRPALGLCMIGVVESKSALTGRIERILNRPTPGERKV